MKKLVIFAALGLIISSCSNHSDTLSEKEIVIPAISAKTLKCAGTRIARTMQEKIYKLKLFPLAVLVIKNAIIIQEIRFVKIYTNKKKTSAKQYALVAKVGFKNPVEIRVIILELEGSANPIFWSIMKN